ncbi:MAG: hypothetical protein Q4B22_01660 [Eubacteriales bacterium]|nr:hypothetical protein [Eubacteriales bacterium]
MKKKIALLAKCILVIFPVLVFSMYAGTRGLAYVDGEIPYYLWNKHVTGSTDETAYDVLILGDSAANAAYRPTELSAGTINLSLGGTTPMENYYILSEWLEYHEAPADLFVSYMDMHYTIKDPAFWKRVVFSHRFSFRTNWQMTAARYGKLNAENKGYYLDLLAYELYLPSKYITAVTNAGFNQRYETNVEAYNGNAERRGRYIAVGTEDGYEGNAESFKTFYMEPCLDVYYRELIQLCEEKGIRLHILRLPLPEGVSYTAEYEKEYDAYFEKLIQGSDTVELIRWTTSYERTFFNDAHHMNEVGSTRFSSELKEHYPEIFGSR